MEITERYCVVVSCPNGHSQAVTTSGMTREMVEDWAGLLDGHSPMYVYPPKPEDPGKIGKCGICGAMLNKSEITEQTPEAVKWAMDKLFNGSPVQ